MSTKKSGNDFQNKIEKFLRQRGFDVINQKTSSRQITLASGQKVWTSSKQDIFACDLIAMKQKEKILFIQASMSGDVTKRLKDFKRYNFPLEHCIVQLWLKRDDGSIAIKEYDGKILIDVSKIIRGKVYSIGNH